MPQKKKLTAKMLEQENVKLKKEVFMSHCLIRHELDASNKLKEKIKELEELISSNTSEEQIKELTKDD